MKDEKTCVPTYKTFELSKSEISERKEILMKELDQRDVLLADLEDHKKRYQALIKTSDLNIEKLRSSIKTGDEMVRVDVYYNDPIPGRKRIVREDNGSKYEEWMDDDEKKTYAQMNVFSKS